MPFLSILFAFLLTPVAICSTISHGSEANLTTRDTSPISLSNSEWIWQTGFVANSFVGLRKGFTPPLGKSLIAAEVVITASNRFSFYVNGDFIGNGTPVIRGRFAQRFCIDLLPSFNVFAVNATDSTVDEAAMIATILLTYSDLTTDTLVSDASWRVHKTVAGFEQLSFDDTTWPVATVRGSFGDDPWDEINIPASPPVVSFDRGEWIWTDAVPAGGTIPAGSRAFRRTFTPAPGQVAASASIIVSVDNAYTLWVNGVKIGTGSNFNTAQHYNINFATAPEEIVFAVLATNSAAGPAGLIFAAEINMVPSGRVGCIAGAFALTDASWVSTKGMIPAGWEQPGFDDSSWPAAVGVGAFPNSPWGKITIGAAAPTITM
ncbi:hypothetical protein MIND_00599000 [Mycena indigotica]|uniref:Uncharacterized protein n=1 Tax=Mycena indigotica TaxID=2126181 RepID=A0A8H6SQL1_9AGAR|nr:uncharacterized protein MIND_00599000 [Mycena indigotica]KAF7303696.1 hypothetical protein MIND_00599000 [Mycena indigotica]